MKNLIRKIALYLIIVPLFVGLSPLIISIIASLIGFESFSLGYHWVTLFTLPIGLGVTAVGGLLFFISIFLKNELNEDVAPNRSYLFSIVVITSVIGLSTAIMLVYL